MISKFTCLTFVSAIYATLDDALFDNALDNSSVPSFNNASYLALSRTAKLSQIMTQINVSKTP